MNHAATERVASFRPPRSSMDPPCTLYNLEQFGVMCPDLLAASRFLLSQTTERPIVRMIMIQRQACGTLEAHGTIEQVIQHKKRICETVLGIDTTHSRSPNGLTLRQISLQHLLKYQVGRRYLLYMVVVLFYSVA